jgi:SOS-response transcriptional repressor LexA
MTQSDLARATGRSTAAVNRWVKNGDLPSLDNVQAIARALVMDARIVAEAAGIELPGDRHVVRSADDILAELEANAPVAVPVIQNLVAHMGNANGHVDEYLYLPPPFRKGKRKNILCVVADGDCMAPDINAGDYVIFDTEAKWTANDIVVAAVAGRTYVKRLIEAGKRYVLRGDADGSTLVLGEEDQIFGRVIFMMRPLVPMDR